MRTNIDINDTLLAKAMALTGLPSKRATVEEGLRLLIQIRQQTAAFAALKGIGWEGDLEAMRTERDHSPA